MISQFSYGYDAEGQITSWQQNNSGFVAASSGSNSFGLNYDAASQLNWATLTGPGGSVTSYSYGFDKAGNRTQEQINSTTTTSSYNGLNQLLGQSAGGLTQFRGTLSKWATVTVGGNPATVSGTGPTYQFEGAANLPAATTSTVQIVATATSGVSGTNNYQVVVAGGSGPTMSYDADGEMTSNGAGQHYQWDAANRLAQIWYGPIGNSPSTTFTYNGLGQRVAIIENDASGNTITKQFVWCPADAQPSEERDGSNIRRFYPQGEQINGANYFFTRDHLGSVREMMDSTGSAEGLQVRYNYDLWGRETKMYGANDTLDADFDYAGYYQHQPSGLNLTMFRAYNPNLARWISRDPIGERGGINLYGYCANDPVEYVDPDGRELIGAIGGAVLGGVIGGITGGWQGAVGGAVGGFVGGLTFNPEAGILASSLVSGALAGLTSDLTKQGLNNLSGCQHGLNGSELGWSTAGGAIGGGLFGGSLGVAAGTAGVPAAGALTPLEETAAQTVAGMVGDAGGAWGQGYSGR